MPIHVYVLCLITGHWNRCIHGAGRYCDRYCDRDATAHLRSHGIPFNTVLKHAVSLMECARDQWGATITDVMHVANCRINYVPSAEKLTGWAAGEGGAKVPPPPQACSNNAECQNWHAHRLARNSGIAPTGCTVGSECVQAHSCRRTTRPASARSWTAICGCQPGVRSNGAQGAPLYLNKSIRLVESLEEHGACTQAPLLGKSWCRTAS